jgi:hypothetical protein
VFWTKDKPGFSDPGLLHFVESNDFNTARAFRKSARDFFVVDNGIAHNRAVQKQGMEIGFLEPGQEAFA